MRSSAYFRSNGLLDPSLQVTVPIGLPPSVRRAKREHAGISCEFSGGCMCVQPEPQERGELGRLFNTHVTHAPDAGSVGCDSPTRHERSGKGRPFRLTARASLGTNTPGKYRYGPPAGLRRRSAARLESRFGRSASTRPVLTSFEAPGPRMPGVDPRWQRASRAHRHLEYDAGHGEVGCRHPSPKVPSDLYWPLSPVRGMVGLPEEQVGRASAQGGNPLRAGEEEDMAAR